MPAGTATPERPPASHLTPDEVEQNVVDNPLEFLVTDSSDEDDSASSSSEDESIYKSETNNEEDVDSADDLEASSNDIKYANFYHKESQKLFQKLNDSAYNDRALPLNNLHEIPETPKDLQQSSNNVPHSENTSSYSSSKHNILFKVQSKREMDLSNVLFDHDSDLEEEFIQNI